MATLDQRNQKNPQEGDTWGGGAYYNGGLGYIIPAGYVYNNGQWVSPLTAQTNNIASQKLRYEADSASTKAAADKASYLAQLQNQQVASTAGNKLNALLQNPESVSSTPGYQFAYNHGLEAVNRTAAAKGQLGSGNRLYDLTKFGQGLASPWLLSHYGLQLSLGLPSAYEWQLLGVVWLAGMVIGLLPAARAYRYSLSDGMSIRV